MEADGGFAGLVMLTRRDADVPGHVRPDGNELEVSYAFRPGFWGQGFATEAARAVLAWVAPLVPDADVILCTQVANERSLRLAVRLGFREVSRFQAHGAWQWLGQREL